MVKLKIVPFIYDIIAINNSNRDLNMEFKYEVRIS